MNPQSGSQQSGDSTEQPRPPSSAPDPIANPQPAPATRPFEKAAQNAKAVLGSFTQNVGNWTKGDSGKLMRITIAAGLTELANNLKAALTPPERAKVRQLSDLLQSELRQLANICDDVVTASSGPAGMTVEALQDNFNQLVFVTQRLDAEEQRGANQAGASGGQGTGPDTHGSGETTTAQQQHTEGETSSGSGSISSTNGSQAASTPAASTGLRVTALPAHSAQSCKSLASKIHGDAVLAAQQLQKITGTLAEPAGQSDVVVGVALERVKTLRSQMEKRLTETRKALLARQVGFFETVFTFVRGSRPAEEAP